MDELMTAPDLSTPESLAQARAEAVALLEKATPGEWKAFPRLKYDEWHVSVPLQDGGGILRLALADNGIRGPNREADAALIAAATTTTLTLIAALDALATTRQALAEAEAERGQAVQALIYAVQAHPQGDIAQDWSSWRVGFGRGVSRGYGRTDAQQLISAVCQATKHDDPYQIPTITEFLALAAPTPEEHP